MLLTFLSGRRLIVGLLACAILWSWPAPLHADPHSYANYQQVRTLHLVLDLNVDFTRQQLSGYAEHWLERLDAKAQRFIVDSKGLKIHQVKISTDLEYWQDTPYLLGVKDEQKGQPLTVALHPDTKAVRIYYQTTANASGLQWLNRDQTSEKKQPFLFSQSQAIHGRSWIPLQDTPATRFTYQANIRTPPELLAVMSADNSENAQRDGDYHFSMPQPVPAYLLALAVGDIYFQPTSANTGVYAEKIWLEKASAEFVDTRRMMAVANRLFGPYPWDRYDLLVLPASFPFGGMENPRLSFITPTVITGDKSLISLVAHELAHSWSGNLVTNCSWGDLWLNEAFTHYVENRLMAELYGARRADIELMLHVKNLQTELKATPNLDTRLVTDWQGRDPEDALNTVSYVKGQLLLNRLAQHFGQQQFEAFLRDYFAHFAFQSICTTDFLRFFRQQLDPKLSFSQAELDLWLYGNGIPQTALLPPGDSFAAVDLARQRWLSGAAGLSSLATGDWTVHQWLHFVDGLPKDLGTAQLSELDLMFAWSESTNPELFSRWALLVIPLNYPRIVQPLRRFLLQVGRLKFTEPLYAELLRQPQWQRWARQVYREARPGYHPLAQQQLDELNW